jgi:hypothetical protein
METIDGLYSVVACVPFFQACVPFFNKRKGTQVYRGGDVRRGVRPCVCVNNFSCPISLLYKDQL